MSPEIQQAVISFLGGVSLLSVGAIVKLAFDLGQIKSQITQHSKDIESERQRNNAQDSQFNTVLPMLARMDANLTEIREAIRQLREHP